MQVVLHPNTVYILSLIQLAALDTPGTRCPRKKHRTQRVRAASHLRTGKASKLYSPARAHLFTHPVRIRQNVDGLCDRKHDHGIRLVVDNAPSPLTDSDAIFHPDLAEINREKGIYIFSAALQPASRDNCDRGDLPTNLHRWRESRADDVIPKSVADVVHECPSASPPRRVLGLRSC